MKTNALGHISELDTFEIFVFGSNLEGEHAGGAARTAYDKFGAIWGCGVGLQGNSYAIPTMDGLEQIAIYVLQFKRIARHMKDYTFYLTPIGTGIAGHSAEDIDALLGELPSNVHKVGWPGIPAEVEPSCADEACSNTFISMSGYCYAHFLARRQTGRLFNKGGK